MERVFGIPAGALTTALVGLLALCAAILVVLALRNWVFVKLGVRNVARRRGRSALIVSGLMLSTTIIATALGTGDTMGATIRSSVFERLGATDELVGRAGSTVGDASGAGGAAAAAYFPEASVERIREVAATRTDLVDGVAAAIVETVAVQNRTERTSEPRVTLFATEPELPDAFGAIRSTSGRAVSLADLADGEVFVDDDAADELGARAGDDLAVFAAGRLTALRVRAVVRFDGTGSAGPSILLPLAAAQQLLDRPGEVRYALVSNAGGVRGGVTRTDEIDALLGDEAARLGLEVDPAKQELLDLADETGNAFMQMFTTFGSFSVVAGILLIFLIFVMLASERRGEMGVARAVGTQRGHLVQSFVFEGVAYDVFAAAIGAAIGIAVSLGMVAAVGSLFAASGFEIELAVQPRSFLLAYVMGVMLTLAVVTVSAWRVSRLNIVTAIRSLPDPLVVRRRRARTVRVAAFLALGALLTVSGAQAKQALPFLLGVSLLIVNLGAVARRFGANDRLVYTLAGVLLVAWWLLPFRVYEAMVPELAMDFSIWVVGGLMLVLGATWTVIHNADALLGAFASVLGRVRSVAPVLRISMAYPLRNRLRTGMTLGMFTLVVYTLVVGATTSRSFIASFDDVERFGGGFDVRASVSPANPVPDMAAAAAEVPGLRADDVRTVAAQATVVVEAAQVGSGRDYEDYVVHGVDDAFLRTTTYRFAATARGYGSTRDVWQALADDPRYAVVDSFVAPRRQNWGFGGAPAFRLSGFWLDDGTFDPVPVRVRDPRTGAVADLTVIGVISSDAPAEMVGLMTSRRALDPFGDLVVPTTYYFDLADGVDPTAYAARLESGLLSHGAQAESFREVLDDAVGASLTFNWLIMGFMALGLVVGIAALGVISARSVVERRQQIGVLRAIGFQPRMVQLGFLAEATFVSLTSIVIGIGLGLATAWNVIDDAARKPDWANVSFHVPWPVLVITVVGVLVSALATTFLPARHASKVSAAAALRYQ